MTRLVALTLALALALGGCYGVPSMMKQARILGYYDGGPREGWNKEDDYKDCNMRVGSTNSRVWGGHPPPAVHACMRDKGYTVSLPTKGRAATPARPLLAEPTWDTGL